ncbi:hypothetical protein [Patiriisocius sp. Uisw_047]|jgi:hypothetical protein|uniref:hypothetical protein n=1 Tax=Patiriisocius sp. Uisw_047 TaxID=3230969 RepID=UPI0039EBEF40
MKKSLFMYLFFFALLFIIFQYMNEKTIFESQEKSINSLTKKMEKARDSVDVLNNKLTESNYFSLLDNDNAMSYLEKYNLDPAEVKQLVTDKIYDQNGGENGNPIIEFKGDRGPMRINKIKFLNHRWIQADFSDGQRWGEVIIEYLFDEKNELDIYSVKSVLFPL